MEFPVQEDEDAIIAHVEQTVYEEEPTEEAPAEDWDLTWLDWEQGYTLAIGLLCGLLFQLLVYYYSAAASGDNAPLRARSEDNMGPSISRVMSTFSTSNKMALIVRTDLGMTKGKAAAQCAHAAIMCYKRAMGEAPQLLKQWEVFGQTKVTLKADSEELLMDLKDRATKAGLVACVVHDAGRTQIQAGSATVLGIGPAPSELVDKVTGQLKLY